MNFANAVITDPGPRQVNEDGVGVWQLEGQALAVAIADGLGGMGSGDIASNVAIEMFGSAIAEGNSEGIDLQELAIRIHSRITTMQSEKPGDGAMATTLTAGVFRSSTFTGVHVGDSRVSVARGNGIRRLTKDHSEAQRLFDGGKLTKSEFRNYPRRNILDSALGAHRPPQIDSISFDVRAGDRFLFSTDGLHEKVLLREIRDLAVKFKDPHPFTEEINSLMEERKAEDNFSLVAVFVQA